MPDNTQEAITQATNYSRKGGGGAKILFVALIVLALAGVIVYLLSLINSKRFFLVPEGGELVVKKGIFFPVGSEPYHPKNPLYKPIELPDELRRSGPIKFDDLPSLNREFARYLIALGSSMVSSEDEKRYQTGRSYLERVENLQGLDAKQLQAIQGLKADVNYIEAKRAYLGVEQTLEHALKKFRRAETFGTGRFQDAGLWAQKIQVLLEAIRMTKASGVPVPGSSTIQSPGNAVPSSPMTAPPSRPPTVPRYEQPADTQPKTSSPPEAEEI